MIKNRKKYEAMDIEERKKNLSALTSEESGKRLENLLSLPIDRSRKHQWTEPIALNLLIHGKKAV